MKANYIVVKFDPKWILSKQMSGKSTAVDDVLKAIKEKYTDKVVVTVNKDFHQCSIIVVSEQLLTKEEISDLLKGMVASADDAAAVGVEIENLDKEKLEKALAKIDSTLSDDEKAFFENEFQISVTHNQEVREPKAPKENVQPVGGVGKASDLIGMDNFKKWIDEIDKIAARFGEVVARTNVIKNMSYLISINRGNGLSTVLNLMAQCFKNNKLIEFSGKSDIVEWRLEYPARPEDLYPFEGLMSRVGKAGGINGGFKGIVSVDIGAWMDHLTDKRFDILLDYAYHNRDSMVFVFNVPYVEKAVLEKVYGRIDDVISTRIMKFVPPSAEQYFEYFKKFFVQYDISVQDAAYSAFMLKVTNEKNDGRFYGYNTVKKIANELLYSIIAEAAKSDENIPVEINEEHFDRLYGLSEDGGVSGLEQLRGMVALNDVKNKVKEILSTVKLQKELYAQGGSNIRPCFHMMFAGNPGTGKTVVARIIGRIFKEEGLLEVGNFFEVSRKDFVGQYVGHTAPKTMEICRNAYGSVLFVDEAYMLAEENDSFSSEAIGTLIAEMENNRDKMVVIFAGYAKELEDLLNMNPGLRDRIPHKIDFPNYSRDELKQIFYLQLNGKMEHDEGFAKKIDEFFANFPEDIINTRDFSNGRFVRNLVERIVSKAALRFEMSGMDVSEFELTETDFIVAVADSDYQKLFGKVKQVKTIGF